MAEINQSCPLCSTSNAKLYFETEEISYFQCAECGLIFVPKNQHLSKEEEKKRYDLHENDPNDKDYQDFLNQIVDPLTAKLKPGMSGLDYGSGPGPTISEMLRNKGFTVENYDPIYSDDHNLLDKKYDFITCTEVVEHFRNPNQDWQRLVNLINPGGWIGIMTSLTDDCTDFSNWHYRRDETHVSFYGEKTISWIAERFNLEASFPSKRALLLKAR